MAYGGIEYMTEIDPSKDTMDCLKEFAKKIGVEGDARSVNWYRQDVVLSKDV